ncbi:uncharacterized protein DDB_G0290587-like [Eriocheir sinensis]|uniref:uncharacterized protein DDB_G0290587-like n=1 Tax=Eriocheir sinensis TaxID=95602 RepID=UPI0021C9B63A|nr:uncharacterized protein DDB_G0290587-like [Eriocheir sinensis]
MKNWMTHSSVHFYRSHSIRCAVPTTLGYKYVMLLEDSDFPTTTTIASHLLTTTIPPTTTTTTTTTTTSISATLDIITDTHNSSEESNATMRMTEESIFIMDDEDEAAVTSAPRHEPPPVNASVSYVDVETAATTDIHPQTTPEGHSTTPTAVASSQRAPAPSPRQPTPTTTPTNAPTPTTLPCWIIHNSMPPFDHHATVHPPAAPRSSAKPRLGVALHGETVREKATLKAHKPPRKIRNKDTEKKRHPSRPSARPSSILEHTKDLWVFRGADNHGLSPG